MQLISWNVNGLRAIEKKGHLDWFYNNEADLICLQETRAWEEQLSDRVKNIPGYHSYFSQAQRKGYSGVALYSREKPVQVEFSFGDTRFDDEGRVLFARYPDFILFNIYFPNGKASRARLQYKMDFYESFLQKVREYYQQGEKIIICGDVNTAHREIDLARPRENENTSGFLPQEREWIDRLLEAGFIDTFRVFNKEGGNYSWWDLKTRARERNVGWRIDYVIISDNLEENLQEAFILPEVMGSDHCPVGVILD